MAFEGVLRWSEGRWIAVAWQEGFALRSPSAGLPVAELLFSRMREKSSAAARGSLQRTCRCSPNSSWTTSAT